MIILRNRNFSISQFFSKLWKNGDNTPLPKSKAGDIKLSKITFAELEKLHPWPSIVTMNLKEIDTKESALELEGLLKNIGLIKEQDYIEEIYVLSDNVKGSNGSCVMCIRFNDKCLPSSAIRLKYGDRMKWVEDFCYNYNKWYKSGK